MAVVLDLPAKVVSFQDEAKECLKLAQAEQQDGELRAILAGMAMGWLRLPDYTRTSPSTRNRTRRALIGGGAAQPAAVGC
jgi:hypothetical protein